MNFGNNINFIDIYIYKGTDFFKKGKLDISTYQNPFNKYMYLPFRFEHAKHVITNYVTGELKRQGRINTKFRDFLNLKTKFYLRLHNRGLKKDKLNRLFSQVCYSQRTEYLCVKKRQCLLFS